jgi:hypothetical protein
MIGSEEEQNPRELLSAHESPEAEADVFADRATGRKTAAISGTGTGKLYAQAAFHCGTYPSKVHGAPMLIQFSKGVENSWTRQPRMPWEARERARPQE